jgi:hypothetical protein
VERDDRLLLLRLHPEVARHQAVVLVGLAVARLPVEQLPARHTDPADEPLGSDLGLVGHTRTKSTMVSRVSWGFSGGIKLIHFAAPK